MEISYYNLSGGINLASTKTELGLDTKRIYWTDSENVEILDNKGIIKQKGNSLFLQLPVAERITGMYEMSAYGKNKLVITTASGKIYIYDYAANKIKLLEKTLLGKKPIFENFLNGVLITSESDGLFYIKNNATYEIVDCNLKDINNKAIVNGVLCVYKGRVWLAEGSKLHYSALGTYNDFTTANDAGYISDFHTDTDSITALKPYKEYLAIYKKDMVYLLNGISPADFAILPFANKGSIAPFGVVNVENKQYFLSNGIFALEQSGELNQIQLGTEISLKIKSEFAKFEKSKMPEMKCLHYETKNQVWYFFPYTSEEFFHTVWINDYVNKSWYKRIIPQNITAVCVYDGYIFTADDNGKIYKEDFGTSFDGIPINFMWKSAFLSLGDAHKRKTIDEFYFLLDESYDNNFMMSVYKDYDSEYSDDCEKIYSAHFEHLIWADLNTSEDLPCKWALDNAEFPIWAVNRDVMQKAEISESNYSVQLCVTGTDAINSCAIIGLQFREIYNDD